MSYMKDKTGIRLDTFAVRARYTETIDDLLARVPAEGPIMMAHRGAGDCIAPENTRAAFRLGTAYPGLMSVDGGDLYNLLGETNDLAVHHNPTVDYATSSTGNVIDFTTQAWRNLIVDPATASPTWFAGAATNENAIMFSDLLREFGGRKVLWPEAKTNAAIPIMAQMAKASGLGRALVLQNGSLAGATQLAAANTGCAVAMISGVDNEVTAAQLIAAGIEWLTFDATAWTDAHVTALINAGIKVQAWTLGRQWEYDYYRALGVHSIASYNPVYQSRNYAGYRMAKGGFVGGAFTHGMMQDWDGNQSLAVLDRGQFLTGGWYNFGVASSFNPRFMSMGQVSPLASATPTIDFDVRFDALAAATDRFVSVALCPTDAQYRSTTTGQKSIELLYRQSGLQQIYSRDGTLAATSRAQQTNTAVTATPTTIHLRVARNGNTVSIARTDAGSANSSPLAYTDATIVPACIGTGDLYLKIGVSDSGTFAQNVSIGNLVVS